MALFYDKTVGGDQGLRGYPCLPQTPLTQIKKGASFEAPLDSKSQAGD
jgi:hypothetical protein